ncbi:hypothetical protein MHYP_G00024030 [Metynnis hypsauchen]
MSAVAVGLEEPSGARAPLQGPQVSVNVYFLIGWPPFSAIISSERVYCPHSSGPHVTPGRSHRALRKGLEVEDGGCTSPSISVIVLSAGSYFQLLKKQLRGSGPSVALRIQLLNSASLPLGPVHIPVQCHQASSELASAFAVKDLAGPWHHASLKTFWNFPRFG